MSEIEKLTADRNLFKGKYNSIIVLLDEARETIQEVVDHVADEGDRRYFGSTNHADRLHDLVDDMDGWSFDAMLPKGDINKMERDPYAVCREQYAALAAKDAELERLRNALETIAVNLHGSNPSLAYADVPREDYLAHVLWEGRQLARKALDGENDDV